MTRSPSVTKRRLAAIFCADVAGYARLMSADEDGTLCLMSAHRGIMDRLIAEYGGRTANTAGDSIVVEFASAVDAVRCAFDIQERIAAVNEDIPQERRVTFRVGVHVGEVMIRDGDMFGEGVNIASRMEKLAPPGLICLSGAAHEFARKMLLAFDDLGPQILKNISIPVQAYLIRPPGHSPPRRLPPVHRHNEFNLARRFHRVLTIALTEVTKLERMTTAEPAVLASLHDAPGISERRLAERIGNDLACVKRMMRHLELRGLICRVAGATTRSHLVSLTPAGCELIERLHPILLAVRNRVMASLSESERETLQELLARVVSANELNGHSRSS